MTHEKCEKTAADSVLLYLVMKVITLCISFPDRKLSWLMKLLFLNAILWVLYDFYFDFRKKKI